MENFLISIPSILLSYAIYASYDKVPKEMTIKIIGFSLLAAIIIAIKILGVDGFTSFLNKEPIVFSVYFLLAISIGFYGYYLFTSQFSIIRSIILIYLLYSIGVFIAVFVSSDIKILIHFHPFYLMFSPLIMFYVITDLLPKLLSQDKSSSL